LKCIARLISYAFRNLISQLCVKREMSEGLGAQSFAQEEWDPLQAEEFELDER
jgi:hypothetical protein